MSFFVLVIIIPFHTSCKKDNINDKLPINDSIVFHDYEPDVILTSTHFYGPDSFHFCSNTPTPIDSIATYRIDISKDLTDDFEVTVQRWMYIGQGSSFTLQPCLRYQNFKTLISPTSISNQICLNSGNSKPKEFSTGEIISHDSDWSEFSSILYIYSVQNQYSYSPSLQEYYLGVKILKDNQDYYGWILVKVSEDQLIIKETSINLSENKKIIAGQKI